MRNLKNSFHIRYVSQSQERMDQICQSHHALEILHLLSFFE